MREKTTDGFDTKFNYSLNATNQISYRFSFQRPEVFDPGLYGIYGGPANTGFGGTGTNKTISTAANWTRIFGPQLIMDVRGGMSYYHNVADSEGAGLTTSTDLGIPGANIDDWTCGHLVDHDQQWLRQSDGRVRRQPAVGPVGEDLERRGHAHQAAGQPHHQVRRRVAAQPRLPAADAGRRRVAR